MTFRRHTLPTHIRTILVYSTHPTILTISLKRAVNIQVLAKPGLNIICLCNLFSTPINISRYTSNNMLLFCRNSQSVLQIYNTHVPSNTLVIVISYKGDFNNLQCQALTSILRIGKLFISRTQLRKFPVPIRRLYWGTHVYKGFIRKLIITKIKRHRLKHVMDERLWEPVNVKWVEVRNCIKNCGINLNSNEERPISAVPLHYDPLSQGKERLI